MNTYTDEDVVTPATYEDVLGAIEGVRDEVKSMIAAAKTGLLMALADALEAKIDERVAAGLKEFRAEAGVVQGCFETAMAKLETVIRAMPRPEVNVAAPSVTVEVPRKTTVKEITYDEQGRPSTITERGAG